MINTREIAAELRVSHWAGIMQERTRSGLSIKAFCRQADICQNTYFYWQRRVRAALCGELAVKPQVEAAAANTIESTRKSLIPSGWVTVCETDETTSEEKTLPIEINGCRVLADANVDFELLEKVCRVLVNLC